MESKSEAVVDLSGKLAVVTGAGRGIGAAIADAFARAALFLASPTAGFITGQTLVVNGGTIGGS